jgi:hypothetical protein
MSEKKELRSEPWLRGTLHELPQAARGVLHALELTQAGFAQVVRCVGR